MANLDYPWLIFMMIFTFRCLSIIRSGSGWLLRGYTMQSSARLRRIIVTS